MECPTPSTSQTAAHNVTYIETFTTAQQLLRWHGVRKNGKVFPCPLPSVGPGADPGVQAVSPQMTFSHPPEEGCRYLPPGQRLPSQPNSITAHQPVSNYTA